MKKVCMIGWIVLFSFFSVFQIYAKNSEEIFVYEDSTASNIHIDVTYDTHLSPEIFDIYRITYYLEERDHRAHIDIDAGNGSMKGYLEPGTYRILGITYMGNKETLKKEPAAIKYVLRIYNNEMTEVALAIGHDSIEHLTNEIGIGNVYTESIVVGGMDTSLTSSDLILDESYGSFQTAIIDEDVLDDEEQYQNYITYMRENGYMDAYGNYTEKAFEEMEISDNTEEELSEYESTKENITPYISSDTPVQEKRFSEEKEQIPVREENTLSKFVNKIMELIPFLILLAAFVFVIFKKKAKNH